MPTGAIIAVFGGNSVSPQTLQAADDLATAVIGAGHILLTGGSLRGSATVKGRAMNAALRCSDNARVVGILPQGKSEPSRPPHRTFITTPWSSYGRNPLNGFLADAAFVLQGGVGTLSEAAFAVALSKPVIFVGRADAFSAWNLGNDALKALSEGLKTFPGLFSDRSPEALIEAVHTRMTTDWADLKDVNAQNLVATLTALLPAPLPNIRLNWLPSKLAQQLKAWGDGVGRRMQLD